VAVGCRQRLTLPEEKALVTQFAKAAGAGELLNMHNLKAGSELAIWHSTSSSTIYISWPGMVVAS
jgi:hypothetical protein